MNIYHESELTPAGGYWQKYENSEPLEFILSDSFYKEFLVIWREAKSLMGTKNKKEAEAFIESTPIDHNMSGFFTFMLAARPKKDEVTITNLGNEGLSFKVQKLN